MPSKSSRSVSEGPITAPSSDGGLQACDENSFVSMRDELPDLTGRLIRAGLHEEYKQYVAKYVQWRKGSPNGAVGELGRKHAHSHGEALTTDRSSFERIQSDGSQQNEVWHPNPQMFDFFFTVSYWVAVSSIMGGLLLTIGCAAPLFKVTEPWHLKLFQVTCFMGDIFYTILCYLQYLQLINMPHEHPEVFIVPKWGPIRQRVAWESCVGTVVFLLSMLLWTSAAILEFNEHLPEEVELIFCKVPKFLGGIGFLVGGICEVRHNYSLSSAYVETWASRCDFLGGLCFAISGTLIFFGGFTMIRASLLTAGMVLYLIAGILLLVMWRGNDFGLLFLRQLNQALRNQTSFCISPGTDDRTGVRVRTGGNRGARRARAGGNQASFPSGALEIDNDNVLSVVCAGRQLSTRGITFIVIYCWIFTSALMLAISHVILMDEQPLRNLKDFVSNIVWMVIVFIVLLIHSTVATVPNQQPYRLCMIVMRGGLFCEAALKTISLYIILTD
mmetsp:Transcript_63750/g.179453  ORF Transcript_63750/g.179453 Transcript_63750/m.179453 type:complete len:501 (+) Transcript_63750:103-1605(+)